MIVANTPSSSIAPTKSQRDSEYRAKRKARKHELIELHDSVVIREQEENPNFVIGFTNRRLLRSGECVDLPHEFAFILKGCEEYIENPQRFPSLFAWGGAAVNNIQCRRLIARVLACILPNTDLIGGRIGLPTEAGMKPVSYDQLQEDYALRWGEFISSKSFGKVIKYLKRASYLTTERINVCVSKEDGTVRSAAAYKQFSAGFFKDLKVTCYSNISKLIMATRARMEKKGFRFSWLSYRSIAAGIQEIFNATRLNESAAFMSSLFTGHQTEQLNLSPH